MPSQKEEIDSIVDPATGEFKRPAAQFRNFISSKPNAEFSPEKGRYHLYVSYACPWAHRTLIVRKLKGLEDIIGFTSVHWYMDLGGVGWRFVTSEEKLPGENVVPDPINGVQNIRELYFLADPTYSGRFSVPVLWDKKLKTIVSNESSEIIRMFNTEFDGLLDEKFKSINLVPEELRGKIDEVNEWIYDDINNGVYKSGIAKTQEAYEQAVTAVFNSLERVEEILQSSSGPYLLGSQLTEADARLYPTIVRFDVVYVTLFKTNFKTIRDGYPNIHRWLRQLYWDIPAFTETTNFEHIKKHYFTSLTILNPAGVVPLGPVPDIREK
jgi:putative glutathione S-transferase